jgi:hypothetical protein
MFVVSSFFGEKFISAAETSQVRHTQDFFDTSMIEVHKDDFMNFMKCLLEK